MFSNYLIETLMEVAERHAQVIAQGIFEQLRGIVLQHVWLAPDGTPIYEEEVTLDCIVKTVQDIFMGDYAMFCLEDSDNGAPAELLNDFDGVAVAALSLIKKKLKTFKKTDAATCREITDFLKTNLETLWALA